MRTQEFLELVMPSAGMFTLAVRTPRRDGPGHYMKHSCYAEMEDFVAAAKRADATGTDVYYTVNTMKGRYYDEKEDRWRHRGKDNTAFCRSLFDDFDVGEKSVAYDTKPEALAAVVKLAQAIKVTPTVVDSGGGYHSYITMDEDFSREEWEELSAMKRDISVHLGLKFDRNVDIDVSRILRPVGLHNYKEEEPRPVKLLKQGKKYPIGVVRAKLQKFIKENSVAPAPTRPDYGSKEANPFAGALGDHAPSDAYVVAEHCAAIREFKESSGNIPEPHWHSAIGVVKFCENGEEIIHDWSKGYEGYSEDETQRKIDNWQTGPTSCVSMDRHIGCMATCPVANKCSFPIHLGATSFAPSVETAKTVEPEEEDGEGEVKPRGGNHVIAGQLIPYWPDKGYKWNGVMLSKAHQDEDGVITWKPFCKSFVYPINRIKDGEGVWVIHWRAQEDNGDWREFFMPMHELASTDLMAKTFASHEVFLARTRTARNDMAEFTETLIKTLQEWRQETKTYKHLGWAENYSKFLIGTTAITLKGEETILCDSTLPGDAAVDFGQSGTLEEWVSNINTLYNRPKAEPFQFALCHSMGSILVELFGSSNWHGLPLAFTGAGGTGKTTAMKIACGFYGNPSNMYRQTGEDGSTLMAVVRRIALMGAVPMLLDEFSGRSPEELTRTGYALANGRDKERLKSNGEFATMGNEWYKNSFVTSNDGIIEAISKLPQGHKVEATQLRFFEVQLPKGFRHAVFPDISQVFIEHHVDHVYGTACRPFIRFVMKNQQWVRRQIVAARSKFNPKSDEDNKERFYRDAIVTALVAGKIAEKLGLISFDVNAMKNWAVKHVESMRESRRENNTDTSEHLAEFISTLPGRLIVTRKLGDARTKTVEHPIEQLRAPAVGRICTEDKKAYITSRCLAEFCKDAGVAPGTLKEEMDRVGLMVRTTGKEPSIRFSLGAGTTTPSSQTRCYELSYQKLFGGTALTLVKTEDGIETKVENN